MNFFTAGSNFERTLKKKTEHFVGSDADKQALETLVEHQLLDDARAAMRRGLQLKRMFEELQADDLRPQDKLTAVYSITVRPDASKIDLDAFVALCAKYAERDCFVGVAYVLEQTGVDDATMGDGFHAHFVAKTRWRSKAEGLRSTTSTFSACAAPNCVQIDPRRRYVDYTNFVRYMLEGSSADGHKDATLEVNARWRERHGLAHPFGQLPLPSSPSGNGN